MYPTSNNYKNNILNVKQVLDVYIDNELIGDYITSFKVHYNLFSNDEFVLGSTPQKEITLEIHKDAIGSQDISEIYIETGLSNEKIPLGYFNVKSCLKKNDYIYEIKAVDDMEKFEDKYDGSNLSYPKTLLQVAQDICTKMGVQLGVNTFLNADKEISVYDSSVSARTYISYIAEQAGGIAYIGRDRKLYIKTYGINGNLNINYFKNYKFEALKQITKISYEDGIQDYKVGTDVGSVCYIDTNNVYIVNRNQIVNIYNELNGLTLNSFEGYSVVDPAIDIGDILTIDSKNIIFQGELEYKGKFFATIKSKIKFKSHAESMQTKQSDSTKFRKVKSILDQQEGKIEQITGEIGDRSEKTTTVTQDIDGINQRVNYLEDFTKEKTETNQLHIDDTIAGDGYITDFIIYGSTQYFVYLAPTPTLTPSPTLTPLGDHFTLVIDKQSRTQGKSADVIELDVKLAEPIRNLNDVCDELRVINGIVSVYRRIGVDDNNELYVLETPTDEIIGALRIPTFDEDTYIYIDEYENLKYYAKYITKNDYSEYFTTKVQLNTALTQTEKEILLLAQEKLDSETAEAMFSVMADNISSKVSKNELTSEISQSAGLIDIKGNRIKIKSDFFELTEDGRIVATSGNIGGFNMDSTSFSKDINGLYDYNNFDASLILTYLRDQIGFDSNMLKIMDVNNDGEVTVLDIIYILNIIRGTQVNSKNVSGTFEINSDDPKRCLIVKDQYGNEVLSLGLGGLNSKFITGEQCVIADIEGAMDNSLEHVALNGKTGSIHATGTITQSSLAEKKKKFVKLENALGIIKDVDIYTYNFKKENDNDKKHIGFVIGDNFRYSKLLTNKDNDGADVYSFVSVCCQAIKEQQEQIDKLKNEINKLKGGK